MPSPHDQGYEQGYRMARELDNIRRRTDRVPINKRNPFSAGTEEYKEFEAGYRKGMRSKPDGK